MNETEEERKKNRRYGWKKEPQTCSWTEDDGIWQSSCGVHFEFNDGGIEQNNFNYCHNCGKKISA